MALRVVSHGRYAFQMAEVAIQRHMFQDILRLIAELRPQPPPTPACDADADALKTDRGGIASRCQRKWPDQPPRPPLGASTVMAVVRAARLSCQNEEKAQNAKSGVIDGRGHASAPNVTTGPKE
jgi:hypothetical protein